MTTEPDMLAGEFALGLLDGQERAEALRRTLADPAFAREVEWWRTQFAELLAEYPPVAAPAGLIDDIGLPAALPNRRLGRMLIPLTIVAAAAAAVLVVMLPAPVSTPPVTTPPAARPEREVLVAALAPATGAGPSIAAMIDREAGSIRIASTTIAPVGKVAELWLIEDGAPRSLGLLSTGAATRLTLPAARRNGLRPGAVLAISIEPAGGSPLPTPTGPVVATGPLSTA